MVVSDFQRRVYEAASKVPRGKVATYKSIAKAIGCKSSRAVGQALKRNPCVASTPCHRIIGTDLSLTGYFGSLVAEKKAILEAEGVVFIGDKVCKSSLFII